MTAVAPLPDTYVEAAVDVESQVAVATANSDKNSGVVPVPGTAQSRIRETHPFSVPESAGSGEVETGDRDVESSGFGVRSTQVDSNNASLTTLPRVPGQRGVRLGDDGNAPDKFSGDPKRTPALVSWTGKKEIEASDDMTADQVWSQISSTPKKKRVAIGHDGELMEQRSLKVQNSLGRRPNAKSLFHAMAGVQRHGDDGGDMHPKLIAVDIDAYGKEWTTYEKRSTFLYFILHSLAWLALTFADPDSWLRVRLKEDDDFESYSASDSSIDASAKNSSKFDLDFWTKMVAQQTAIWVVFSVCGLAVVTRGWNEGYSRKVCHVVMYLMPFLMHMVWPKQDGNDGASSNSQLPTVWVMSWTVWFQFVPFYLQIKPARRRSTFLMLVFKAYDRAQDRPHTLVWLLTQLAGGYVVILGLYMYLQNRGSGTVPPGAERAILIPVVVNVFGDGLAEPIGIAFGRHKYRARALWYKGRCCAGEFKRTLEGSAVVYFVTLLAVIPCRTKPLTIFSLPQYATALALLPPLLTVTEAFAPHTWDNPFITLVGAVFLLGLYELVP